MLVSMECLTGFGLHPPRAPGRVDPHPAAPDGPPRRGLRGLAHRGPASHHAQLWIDRNFTLDTPSRVGEGQQDPCATPSRAARSVIKDSAFAVLTDMIENHLGRTTCIPVAITPWARELLAVCGTLGQTALRSQAEQTVAALLPVIPRPSAGG
jgi:hypothetical protein